MRLRFPFAGARASSGKLAAVQSFTIYYGELSGLVMDKLACYDLAIIEPQQFASKDVAALQEKATVVIGYLSVMEAPMLNQGRFQRLLESDFLRMEGKKRHFAEWDSYLMDVGQLHYRELLLEEIAQQIIGKQANGLLLDTVGDIDDYIADPLAQTLQRQAYTGLLHSIQVRFPGLLLLQNRGFGCLELALPYLDGLLWEDWRGGWRADAWSRMQVEKVKKARKMGLSVFTVSGKGQPEADREARKLGFVHTETEDGYRLL